MNINNSDNNPFTISDILLYSPFDSIRDVKNLMSIDDFFEKILVKKSHFNNQVDELWRNIDSDTFNYKIINIDGYAGIGKTTFINYFIRSHRLANFLFIDFNKYFPLFTNNNVKQKHSDNLPHVVSDLLDKINTDPKNSKRYIEKIKSLIVKQEDYTNPILSTIKAFLNEEINLDKNVFIKKKYINHLLLYKNKYASYFSRLFLSTIEFYNNTNEIEENFSFILNDCDFKDVFILFFLFQFIQYEENKPGKQIIIFDNLDAVNLDFLSDYFCNNFKSTLSNISHYVNKFFPKIDFNKDYKFIFILRDGNGAIVNSHLMGAFAGMKTTFNFRINYDSSIYKEIIERRINYYLDIEKYGKKIDDTNKRKLSFLLDLLKDEYINEVIIPLFNADIRKTVSYFLKVTFQNSIFSKSIIDYNLKSFTEIPFMQKFGLRGAIIFEILESLKKEDIFKEYPFYSKDNNICAEGHISHLRLILIALINLSNIKNSKYVNNYNFRPKNVTLTTLFKETELLFSNKEVLNILIESFKLHTKNWANLVTFRNIPFHTNVDIKEFLSGKIDSEDYIEIKEYNDTCVNINPSGFVYIKYLLTHFEFYSSILAGNEQPLFLADLSKNENDDYVFILIIQNVYVQIKRHIEQIAKCYTTKIDGELGLSRKEFEASVFAFRHLGNHIPSPTGLSHTIRVITSAIVYLDTFRLYILTKNEIIEDYKHINRLLIIEIEKINELFKTINNRAAVNSFYYMFKNRIDLIKNNPYDKKTSVVNFGFQKKYFELMRK